MEKKHCAIMRLGAQEILSGELSGQGGAQVGATINMRLGHGGAKSEDQALGRAGIEKKEMRCNRRKREPQSL